MLANALHNAGHDVRVTRMKTDAEISYPYPTRTIAPTFFPERKAANAFQKIVWHAGKWRQKLFSKGWYWDPTISSKRSIQEFVKQDLNEGVDAIIVTCAPFRWSFYIATCLQSKGNNAAKLIVDLRDEWTSNQLTYFTYLSDRRIKQEKLIEMAVIERADHVTVVHPKIAVGYQSCEAIAIPNFVESLPESFGRIVTGGTMEFVFAGTLYADGLESFLKLVSELCHQAEKRNRAIRLIVLGNWSSPVIEKLKHIVDCEYIGYVSADEVKAFLRKSDFILSYVSPKMGYALNTKILEAIGEKRPVMLISEPNLVSEFVKRNKVGFVFDPVIEELQDADWDDVFSEFAFGPIVDREHDLDHAMHKLLELFSQPKKKLAD